MSEAEQLFEDIRPILAGKHPDTAAKTIAGLMAWLLAGIAPTQRDEMRRKLIKAADELLPAIIEHNIAQGTLPCDWRRQQ